jgi:hypothetical protein
MTVSNYHTFDFDKAEDLLNSIDVESVDEINDRPDVHFHVYFVLPEYAYDAFDCPAPSDDGRVCCYKLKLISY